MGKKDSKPKKMVDVEIQSVSLVDYCPICGSKDLTKPTKHPKTGKLCKHPTKFEVKK